MTEEERIELLLNNRKLYERNRLMRYTDTLAPWKQRFCEEYFDLDDKIQRLNDKLREWDMEGKNTNSSYNLMNAQLACMIAYKSILMERSIHSDIDLFKWREENEKK